MALEFTSRFRTKEAQRDLNKFTKKAGSDVKRLEKQSVASSKRMAAGFASVSKVLGPPLIVTGKPACKL